MGSRVAKWLWLTLLLGGCATATKPAPAPIADQLGQPQAGKAVLVVVRENIKPAHFSVTAAVDGAVLAELPNHTFTWTYLEPGEHTLSTRWQEGALIPKAERSLMVEADKYYLVEIRGGVGVSVLFRTKELKPNNTRVVEGNYQETIERLADCCRWVPAAE